MTKFFVPGGRGNVRNYTQDVLGNFLTGHDRHWGEGNVGRDTTEPAWKDSQVNH